MGLPTDIFVGRKFELSQLREGLENARSGRGQLVLLAGEAGIGKSRLSDELSKIAETLNFEVAWGRCWESEGAPAYWPWTEALRGCLYGMRFRAPSPVAGQSSTKQFEVEVPISDSLVSRLERWLNQRKTNPTPSHQSQLIDSNDLIDTQQERSLLFESVLQLLTDISLPRPTLLLFEDFHAADRDSILLLQFIARHLRSLHIMIVVTFRNEDRTTADESEDLLEALCREGKTLTISGLSAEDVNEVVKRYLGQANKSLSLELFNLTEGNPFFLTETIRLISSDKGRNKSSYRTSADLDIPRSVRKTMYRRFQAISPAVRDLLTLASVIGREFDPNLLGRVSGKSVEELLSTLDEAAEAALIYPELTSSGKYQFRHALIAETLYDKIPIKVRRTLHLSVAGYLEDIHSANLDPYFSELAHHQLSALPMGDLKKAVKYAELGASRAMNMLAYEEASRLYEIALHALGTFVDPHQRCKLLLNLASARALAEDYVGAREACEEAGSIARELALPAEFADATIYYGWQTSSFGTVDRKLVDMLEEALSLVGANGGAIRAILLARLAQELYWSDEVSRREELSAQSVAIARITDDPGVIVRSLYSRYLALWNPENDQERLAVLRELVEVAERNGLKNWRQRVSWPLIGELFGVGDVVGALAEMENIERLDTELKRQTGFPEAARAAWALLEGRFEEGERLAAKALDIAGPKNPAMAQIFASQISLVRREQGRMAEIIPIVETIVSQAPRLTFARCGLASCYAESDKRAQAAAEFEYFAANNFSTIPKDATWIASAVLLADVCCYLDDSPRASILYEHLLPHSSKIAVLGSQVCYGAMEYYLGKLAFMHAALRNC